MPILSVVGRASIPIKQIIISEGTLNKLVIEAEEVIHRLNQAL
ncbi:hypothetical protein [Neobacillus endophyticus]|nr:hypothetical protein [Neobacillus endophyticus]